MKKSWRLTYQPPPYSLPTNCSLIGWRTVRNERHFRAVDRAMQTHGAMGFTNELGLHDAWHSLRIVNVADGTNEILRRTIVQRMRKGDVDL